MKRLLIVLAAVLAAGSGAGWAATLSPSHARLRHFICQRARDPASRAITTTAVMRSMTGTTRLALRFQLLGRTRTGAPWTAVNGGDLGTWISPVDPSLGRRPGDVWILNKQVVDLAAPANYRFRVTFRWSGSHGRTVFSAVRETPICAQPELRPDLLVQGVAVTVDPASPSLDVYEVTIRNRGATAAGPFDVLFSPGGGAAVKTRSVAALPARSLTHVRFRGPVCSASSPPTITVDPNQQVDDFNRANNSMTVACAN